MRYSSSGSVCIPEEPILVEVTYGFYRGRLGIVTPHKTRLMGTFESGEAREDVDAGKYRMICTMRHLRKLLCNSENEKPNAQVNQNRVAT
jgi:hypothetical protein